MFAQPRRLVLIVALLLLAGAAGAAEDGASAIQTPGSGRLTMCRSWLLFSTCRDYSNVTLPERITLGDRLPLSFGSNPKDYEFPVKRIVRDGAACMLLSETAGATERANRIEVASCRDAAGSQ